MKYRAATSESQKKQSNQLTKQPTASRKWWTLLGIGIDTFMFALDIHIVNLALPTLVQELHTSFATIQWVPWSVARESLTLGTFALTMI